MPEDKTTSGPDASVSDAAPEAAAAPKRIAIRARDSEIGEALWQTIERASAKKGEAQFLRAPREQADIVVYALGPADLADLRGLAAEVTRDRAPVKFLLEPAGDAKMRERTTPAMNELGRLTGAGVLSAEDSAISYSVEDTLQKQAKAIARSFRSEDDKAERKTGKREAKVERRQEKKEKKEKKAGKKTTETRRVEKKSAKRGAKEERKASSAKQERKARKAKKDKAARAEKKSAKRTAKQERKSKKPSKDKTARAEKKAAKRGAKAGSKDASAAPLVHVAMPAAAPAAADVSRADKKAAKRAAKEKSAAEAAAKRAEKKSAKRAAKEERKSAKPAKGGASSSGKKAGKGAAALVPAGPDAARAEKKAAKRAAKEERKSHKGEKPAKAPKDEAARAEKKAAKRAAKEERKSSKGEKGEASPEDEAARAEKKAAKKAAKVEKRKNEKAALTPEEKAAKRAAKRAARSEPQIGPDGEIIDETKPLRLMLGDERLRPVVEAAFAEAGVEVEGPKKESKADLVVYAFDDPPLGPQEIAARAATLKDVKARLRIFLERAAGDELEESNRAIARLAGASDGSVLRLNEIFRRMGAGHLLEGGRANEEGLELIADGIVAAAAGRLPRREFKRKPRAAAPDLVEARALASEPASLLSQIKWSGAPPKSIGASLSPEQTEALADSKLLLTDELALPFRLPIDWDMDLEDHRAERTLLSLDFLTGPLAYWYARASGVTAERITQIDAALKQRGSSPNAILMRATQIVSDFIAKHPLDGEAEAWSEAVVRERARVMMLFLLCCKAALKRKIKFSESACSAATMHLLDMVEMLRADDFYVPCTVDGVQQDCLTIGLALGLRGTAYGNALLAQSLERFKTMQLDLGLTADGVWFTDSYSMHCAVLSQLSMVLGDFPVAESAQAAPFAAIAKKMTAFAEAMLKSNGVPPAIDDSRQKSYAEKLSGQRRTIAKATTGTKAAKVPLVRRIIDTYIFRDAQYFISHSSQKVEADSSLVVLHADPPSVARHDPGGIVLVFAHGERDLLVRAKLAEKIRGKADRTPLYDPQLRNGYRVNGAGNLAPEPGGSKAARIVKSWRGEGWAAAKSIEDTYAGASVARVAIHLKTLHALIVVDELSAGAEFEQFWNPGPDLAVPETADAPLRFAAGDHALVMAFAPEAPTAIDRAETGATVHRRPAPGVAASVFQWTDGPAPPTVAVERAEPGNWAIVCEGKGFTARLSLAGSDLSCQLEAQPIS
ncbi:MAG: hypothetical protein JOZ72_17575 [Alphaproteobacteria bacterium]|nr:hypothetical protein [Alphaproteobacteria bacterium]